MYRDRFRGERQQIDRLEQLTGEALGRLDKGTPESLDPWLVASLVPNSPGDMTMSFPGVAQMQHWAHNEHSNNDLMEGFFQEMPPAVGVSVQRYTLSSSADRGKPLRYDNAVCYVDGAGAAARQLHVERQRDGRPVLLAPRLVFATVGALRLLGRHAVHNAGARGDAAVEVRVIGPHMLLGYSHDGLVEYYRNALLIREARARLTLPLASLTGDAQDVLIAARLALADVFNAFGLAESPYIAPDGTLRLRYFPSGYHADAWAERHGVATTQQAIPE